MIIFLDAQTTGLEVKDKICSVGIVAFENAKEIELYELINEGKKIPSYTSSINHITNEMLRGKPRFLDTEVFKFLKKYNNESTVIVGHNIKFDLEMLKKSGFDFIGSVIDTLRVTKHLIPECDFFSLQYLRYELRLYKQETKSLVAYNALDNAKVLKYLYEYLLDYACLDKQVELSLKNVLVEKFKYGKYANHYIEEIAINDKNYLEWMLLNVLDMDEDLRYSIEYFLKGDI